MNFSPHGDRNFAEAILLRVMRWGDYPGLLGWVRHSHEVLIKAGGGAGRRVRAREEDEEAEARGR